MGPSASGQRMLVPCGLVRGARNAGKHRWHCGEPSRQRTGVDRFGVLLLAAALSFWQAAPARSNEDRCRSVMRIRTSAAAVSTGAITRFVGVGGGFLVVPCLTNLLGLSVRQAIATSLVIIPLVATAAAGAHTRASASDLPWGSMAVLRAGIAAGPPPAPRFRAAPMSERLPAASPSRWSAQPSSF